MSHEGRLVILAAAVLLSLLGVVHTVLGERLILRPLAARPAGDLPLGSRTTHLVLRFAWHLTTLTWFAFAAAVLGDPVVALAVFGLLAGFCVLVVARGHLAWPVLLAVGLLAGRASGLVTDVALGALVGAGVAVALVAAALHLRWAVDRDAMPDVVLPTHRDGGRTPVTTVPILLVAASLLALAGLLVMTASGAGGSARWLVVGAFVVLCLRIVGDGRQVGFSRTVHGTGFARADASLFTPMVVVLAFGAGAALLH